MGIMQSAASWVPLIISSTNGRVRRSPPVLMDSAPRARPISMLPVAIWFAMSCVALRPDEQKRLTEEALVVLGKPAERRAART